MQSVPLYSFIYYFYIDKNPKMELVDYMNIASADAMREVGGLPEEEPVVQE